MAEQFLIWSSEYEEGRAVVRGPEGIKKAHQLSSGISRAEGWPTKVACRMSDEYPKDIELTDNLYGTGLTVISDRVKKALADAKVNGVEYLPVQVYNHKNKVASSDYAILNPLTVVDCIDTKASGVQWNDVEPELLDSCKKLVFKKGSVPETIQVFRPKHAEFVVLVRSTVAKALEKAKLTGLLFTDPLEFRGS